MHMHMQYDIGPTLSQVAHSWLYKAVFSYSLASITLTFEILLHSL
jgi:hypothetical protein